MWPRLGPFPTYGVCHIIGFVFHFVIAYLLARRFKLRHRIWIIAGICFVLGMTIGAKVLYDIQKSQFDLAALFTMEHYIQGGMWGGQLAYFALAVPLVLLLSKHRCEALDLVAMSVPVPWIFAKLGCLFNGCCYGKPSTLPWAITYPQRSLFAPAGIPLHPTQIYEIIIMIIVVIVFIILRSEKWRGTMLLWFLVIYGFGRAITEIWRGDFDHHRYIGPLTLSQLICLVAAGTSFLILIIKCRFNRKNSINKPEI